MSELALERIAENKKTKATTLDLGDCGLTELPEALFECIWLEELYLSSTWEDYITYNALVLGSTHNAGESNNIKFLPNDISNLCFLKKLYIGGEQGENWSLNDLSPIAELGKLEILDFSYTMVNDLGPLSRLSNLECIFCGSTLIKDLSPLVDLKKLKYIFCGLTKIKDLSPVAKIKSLTHLFCFETLIEDISGLRTLDNLQEFSCSYTKVIDLAPIRSLVNIQALALNSSRVTDLSPILPLIKKGKVVKWQEYHMGGISVHNCPLVIPPIEFAQAGNEAVLEYFDQ
ncbi:MAG: hypothetical protein WCR52_02780, partial [Bacteroidota bacterium]